MFTVDQLIYLFIFSNYNLGIEFWILMYDMNFVHENYVSDHIFVLKSITFT